MAVEKRTRTIKLKGKKPFKTDKVFQPYLTLKQKECLLSSIIVQLFHLILDQFSIMVLSQTSHILF